MLLNLFKSGFNSTTIPFAILSILAVLLSLSLHECSHGLAAYSMGDPTAKNQGRLTLNPLKHLNPIGTICMLLVGFGWANPVPVNANYFKNRKLGMALTALAGPVSNLLLSFIALLCSCILNTVFLSIFDISRIWISFCQVLSYFFYALHIMNIYLAIFNLIPIPPLDGSRILNIFLPERYYFKVMKYEQYIAIALIILVYLGVLSGPLSSLTDFVSSGMSSLLSLIPAFSKNFIQTSVARDFLCFYSIS